MEARAAYHHGNLAEALVDASLELTRVGGADALSLRDATRRAGVSPNAAYRHFADRDALVAAAAVRIQQGMAERMRQLERVGETDAASARARLTAVGLGYIAFALDEPGWFDVAFGRMSALPDGGPGDIPAPLRALVTALDDLVDTGALPRHRRPGAEWPCWSAVHGFALLALTGPLARLPRAEVWPQAERTVATVIDGLLD
jgi:AcrR family transcriptional regulator